MRFKTLFDFAKLLNKLHLQNSTSLADVPGQLSQVAALTSAPKIVSDGSPLF
jgi:hypothetical protein